MMGAMSVKRSAGIGWLLITVGIGGLVAVVVAAGAQFGRATGEGAGRQVPQTTTEPPETAPVQAGATGPGKPPPPTKTAYAVADQRLQVHKPDQPLYQLRRAPVGG